METMNQNRDGFGAHLDKLGPGGKSQELEYSWLSQILGVGIATVEKEAGEFAELHKLRHRRLKKLEQHSTSIDPSFEEVHLTPRHGFEDEQYGPPLTTYKDGENQARVEASLLVIVIVAICLGVYFSVSPLSG